MSPIHWSITLCLIGLMLILLDAMVPSGGVLTVFGTAAFIGSVIAAFMVGPTYGAATLIVEVALVGGLVAALIKWWPQSPLGRRVLIQPADRELTNADQRVQTLQQLVGKRGVARSKMLLSGAVELDGQVYDAVSQAEAIEIGQPVRVVKVRARQLVVRLAEIDTLTDDDPLDQPIENLGIDPLDDPLG